MFDVGFQELALIGVIALIVVGPERLPKMARTVGLWMGKIRYYVSQVKNDIEREVRAQELKEMLDKPAGGLEDLHKVAEETKDTLNEAKAAIESVPNGLPAPNEPAAGSIFPAELPGPGAKPTPADSAQAEPAASDPAALEPALKDSAAPDPAVTETAPGESPAAEPAATRSVTTRPPATGEGGTGKHATSAAAAAVGER